MATHSQRSSILHFQTSALGVHALRPSFCPRVRAFVRPLVARDMNGGSCEAFRQEPPLARAATSSPRQLPGAQPGAQPVSVHRVLQTTLPPYEIAIISHYWLHRLARAHFDFRTITGFQLRDKVGVSDAVRNRTKLHIRLWRAMVMAASVQDEIRINAKNQMRTSAASD